MHQPIDFPDYLNFPHGFKFDMPAIFTCIGHPDCVAVIGGIVSKLPLPDGFVCPVVSDYSVHAFCWWDTKRDEFHACYQANTPEDSYL